jgi:transcriptional regulator with XRE-family HTH domain
VAPLPVDLDLLATHLAEKMRAEDLSIRTAAPKIGVSPATLGRLLQGSKSASVPDSVNLMRAAEWLRRSLADFQRTPSKPTSTIADVEVHLRALPDLSTQDVEALVAMVRGAYDNATKLRSKKGPRR